MRRGAYTTETVISPVDSERAFRIADECLIEIRLVETRREKSIWLHEYEVSGEAGKVSKFVTRLRQVEIKRNI